LRPSRTKGSMPRSKQFYRKTTVLNGAVSVSAIASSGVFSTGVGAVSQLIVTTAVGASTVYAGLIEPASISALSRVLFNLFLPCYLFCNVIKTVTAYGVSSSLLAMPVAAALQIAFALTLSKRVMLPLLGVDPKSDAGKELTLSASLHNPGVLPLLFFDALFRSPYPDPTVLPQMAAYVSFYLMGFSPLFWAIGPSLMSDADADGGHGTQGDSIPIKIKKAVVKFVSPPPVAAALMGLLIATTPFLRGFLVGDAAPLRPVFTTLENFAKAYLPSASLVLAGSLVSGAGKSSGNKQQQEQTETKDNSDGDDEEATQIAGEVLDSLSTAAEPGFKRSLAALAVTRFCVMPLVGFGVLRGLASAGVFPHPTAAPTLWFFLLTQFSMPPAQNSVIMLQVLGKKDAAARMAKNLLLSYAIATVPLTFLFSIFMAVTGL